MSIITSDFPATKPLSIHQVINNLISISAT